MRVRVASLICCPSSALTAALGVRVAEEFALRAILVGVDSVWPAATSAEAAASARFAGPAAESVLARCFFVVEIALAARVPHPVGARRGGNLDRYRSLMRQHWVFFRVTEPVIALLVPLVVYLAVAKPF